MRKLAFPLIFLCSTLFSIPPKEIPLDLYEAYTNGGDLPVIYLYVDESPDKGIRSYTKEHVSRLINKAKRKETNYYGKTDDWLYQILDQHPELIAGKTVAIMGSGEPWYEAIVLA